MKIVTFPKKGQALYFFYNMKCYFVLFYLDIILTQCLVYHILGFGSTFINLLRPSCRKFTFYTSNAVGRGQKMKFISPFKVPSG